MKQLAIVVLLLCILFYVFVFLLYLYFGISGSDLRYNVDQMAELKEWRRVAICTLEGC